MCDGAVRVLGCRLRVEVELDSTGEWLWAEYENMRVAAEADNYTLQVTGYHGNAGDAFNDDNNANWRSNGMQFSTPDRDNDEMSGICTNIWSSGWWFRACSSSCLNGVGKRHGTSYGVMFWYSTGSGNDDVRPVSTSRMMLQC